jgi:F0F1-type ATP synthase, delta subunit (mitochondrial oligomycin sensitivity protein)
MKKTQVYSPRVLNSEEKNKVSKLIFESTGEAKSDVSFYVDESLIDGLKIIYNDKMLDLSLEGQIKSLKGE